MARIELRGVAHSYRAQPTSERDYAVKSLDLVWKDGGAYALLGSSGCGKTTLLNIISGLLRPSQGSVSIDGKDVTQTSPQARNIAQVFQFPVIYDTMTVFDNLAFPLKNRGLPRAAIQTRVHEIAELLELTAALDKRASGLSADMKQRISLGRGLVRKEVAAILLDEPLTVIDPHAKWRLRRKLMQVHSELSVTLIYVTHDQGEALTLADEVVLMSEGRIVQQGTPQELFERPVHTFVGYFIGSPGMNLLSCSLVDGSALVDGQRIALPEAVGKRARAASGELMLGARPEFLQLHRLPPANAQHAARAVVTELENRGHFKIASARLGTQTVKIKLPESYSVQSGETCWVEFPPEWTILYAGGRAV